MIDYKRAGVDIEAGYAGVKMIKEHAKRTVIPGVLSEIGGFNGLFSIDKRKYKNPVLVSGTDGVGTKLKIAFILDKHDSIGQDCVAMCINDIICSGARPLFFLDYIALDKNDSKRVSQIVKGVSDGCIMSGCALIGGETAQMPDFYSKNEYDLAGFAVGIVEKDKIIDGNTVTNGDYLIGIASSGVHSNGFSLIRKIFNLNGHNDLDKLNKYIPKLNCTLGEELIKPTKIYASLIKELNTKYQIKAISHITGGGFIENIPRMLPSNMKALIHKNSWDIPMIFNLIKELDDISDKEMYNTFNMGIGMVLVCNSKDASKIIKFINKHNEKAYLIGEVLKDNNGIDIQ